MPIAFKTCLFVYDTDRGCSATAKSVLQEGIFQFLPTHPISFLRLWSRPMQNLTWKYAHYLSIRHIITSFIMKTDSRACLQRPEHLSSWLSSFVLISRFCDSQPRTRVLHYHMIYFVSISLRKSIPLHHADQPLLYRISSQNMRALCTGKIKQFVGAIVSVADHASLHCLVWGKGS